MKQFPNYYQDIVNEYPNYIPNLYEKNIDNDLHRTFPEEPFFKDPKNLQKIQNILNAFTRRNTSIGYTQGFNFIIGRILNILNDEVRNNK